MRVAYAVETDAHGGAEVYVERLAAHTGGDVFALGPAPVEGAQTLPRPRGKTDVLALLRVARALRGHDLVHVNANEPANARYAMAASWLARVPYVVTLHTPGALSDDAQDRVLRTLYGRASAVVAVSREIAAVVATLGVAAVLIPNGVPLPSPAEPSRRARPVVGMLGRLAPEKGVDVLLAATRDLDVDVEIGGDGPLREALEGDGRAAFRGRVEPEAFLRGLDVFVLASRSEGLPFALLEAMALGLPCVATRVGDVPEALEGAGVLVAPDDVAALRDAIAGLAGDPAERARLGALARARVTERYTVERMLAATGAVYAAASRRPRRATPPPRSAR